MVTTTTWKKVAWKAQVIILSCYQKTLAVSKKEVFPSYQASIFVLCTFYLHCNKIIVKITPKIV